MVFCHEKLLVSSRCFKGLLIIAFAVGASPVLIIGSPFDENYFLDLEPKSGFEILNLDLRILNLDLRI